MATADPEKVTTYAKGSTPPGDWTLQVGDGDQPVINVSLTDGDIAMVLQTYAPVSTVIVRSSLTAQRGGTKWHR
jgi:hypothetical protein